MIEIRESSPSDYREIAQIWFAASILAHPFIEQNLLEDVAKKLVYEHLPKTKTFVAIYNNTIVGFISTINDYIAGLFVHPDYQGRGIGKSLLSHIIPNHLELTLHVFKKNIKTHIFYKKFGFVEIADCVHEETGEIQIEMKLVNKTENFQ